MSASMPPNKSQRSLAIAAVIVVGLAVIGILLWPILTGEPAPSQEPTPTVAVSASAGPSATVAPTQTPIATPTAESTPTPVARWTGLDWSDPVTPSFVVHLRDLVAWNDGYVAVGDIPVGAGLSQAAFLTSPDGLDWTVRYQVDPVGDRFPSHLVVLDEALYAFSPRASDEVEIVLPGGGYSGPLLWTSTDGVDWELVDSPSWEAGWADARQHVGTLPDDWSVTQHGITTGLVDVAVGPNGLVAIGNAFGDDGMLPIVLASTDAHEWTTVDLPSTDSPMLNAVAGHGDRLVITGAIRVGAEPATASAAAWYSDDGRAWIAATVEPGPSGATGTEFGPLWAAEDGLIACRGNREMGAGGWRYMDAWLSADGATWRHSPQPGPHRACDWSASDGVRIVALGPRDHASPTGWPGVTVASVSTDGVTWEGLELGSTLTDRLERFWVVPDGVIYAGEQSFWFGTPIAEGG